MPWRGDSNVAHPLKLELKCCLFHKNKTTWLYHLKSLVKFVNPTETFYQVENMLLDLRACGRRHSNFPGFCFYRSRPFSFHLLPVKEMYWSEHQTNWFWLAQSLSFQLLINHAFLNFYSTLQNFVINCELVWYIFCEKLLSNFYFIDFLIISNWTLFTEHFNLNSPSLSVCKKHTYILLFSYLFSFR